ncbi:MAG TPA: PAS domain-containing hybrid sensor histidine kinase/response regulator [Desulfobulbus sp.]|nr:PAS domain-containing hybrid sensor histidine kinase/response regulator [Desulfobulbus sp.]
MGTVTIQQLKLLTDIIEQEENVDAKMQATVNAVRDFFSVNNAWLLYPCVQDTPSCRRLFFSCRSDAPCFLEQDAVIQVDSGLRTHFKEHLEAEQPLTFQDEHCRMCLESCPGKKEHCSQLSMILKMKNDRHWLFGLCDCSIRHWSRDERDLFQLAGERLQHAYDTVRLMETIQRDIAKRQKVESEILRSEQRFRSLFQHTSISLWMLDVSRLLVAAGRSRSDDSREQTGSVADNVIVPSHELIEIVDVNSVTLELFAAHDKEHLLSSLGDIISENSLSTYTTIVHALLNGKTHFTLETDFFTLTGRPLVVILNVDVLPPPDAHMVLISVTDISARKKIEEKLFDSREQYRLLMENSSDAIFLFDAQSLTVLEANPKAVELTGRSIDQLIGLNQKELHPAEDHDFHRRLFREYIQGNISGITTNITVLHKSGRRIPVQISASTTTIKGRTIIQRIYHDLSERIVEEEQRRLLATAVEQSEESVVITDPEGTIEYINPAYTRTTGYSWQEVVGKKPGVFKSGKMPQYLYRLLWQDITAGKVWQGKIINKKKTGILFTEDVIITPVKDRQGKISHFVAVKRDITRQDQLENLVRQSQKMQAIGTLAGGIAHDFNNILTAILGFAELSVILCNDNTLLKSNLSEIITASERAGKLIDQILTFSRQTEKNVSSLRVDPIVKEVLKLLRASLPANIEISTDIRSKAMVRADPTQIHQVVMNLCTNAYQALADQNGRIRVTLDSVLLAPHEGVDLGNLPAGEYVTLTVADNGRGIAREHLNRIFEPYFTTKDKNEGTGLGLSVVHGIVNDHGGAVTVQSIPGEGSSFTVYLPRIPDTELRNNVGEVEFLIGEGRVLLVDDEQQIVDYEVQTLEKAGYVTIASTSSVEALDIFKKQQEMLDLVITDMAMPEMTGLQLFKEIRKIRPDIPVLLCTGYSEHVTAESSTKIGIDGYLAKPFTAEQLAGEVHRLLSK